MITIDALGPGGPYRSRAPQPLTDVSGARVGDVSLVPTVFVDRAMAALRRAEPAPADERVARVAAAAQLFADAPLGGVTVDEYQHLVSRVGGLPITVVREATRSLV